jgi:hypothetical protein
MPKRKISLEEAFKVFEDAGLEVEIKGVLQQREHAHIADFLEESPVQNSNTPYGVVSNETAKNMKITLYAKHSIASSGTMTEKNGVKSITGNTIETYGPGIVTVPSDLASQLLHQDCIARQTDERMLDRKFRSYVILQHRTAQGMMNKGVLVSEDDGFSMSSFLGSLGNTGNVLHIG